MQHHATEWQAFGGTCCVVLRSVVVSASFNVMQQTGTSRQGPQGTAVLRSRLEHGLTLRQLADECMAAGTSVHYSTLSRIECGEIVPRPALLATLAKVLDLDVAELERKAS